MIESERQAWVVARALFKRRVIDKEQVKKRKEKCESEGKGVLTQCSSWKYPKLNTEKEGQTVIEREKL